MRAEELSAWRRRFGLSQDDLAKKFGVTRTTIQNWEAGATTIPTPVDDSCQLWEARLKQEAADVGPVSLIYSDGPMFVSPYGPRTRLAMLQQEPYPTNAAAIARVQRLFGRDAFFNPLIIEAASGKPLWNMVELQRVVDGSDKGAPTLVNTIVALANHIHTNSQHFGVRGTKLLAPEEKRDRQLRIQALARQLQKLAADVEQGTIDYLEAGRIEEFEVRPKLHALGFFPAEELIGNFAHAVEANRIVSEIDQRR
jgi:DNA-binding XRE family transcriptional regulator